MSELPVTWRCERHEEADHSVRVALAGELDLRTAPSSARMLQRAQAETADVVVDVEELEFMDVIGLHVLQDAEDRARRSGGRFAIRHANGAVRQLLDFCGGAEPLDVAAALARRRWTSAMSDPPAARRPAPVVPLFGIEEHAEPGGRRRLHLTGELDMATSPQLAARLAAAAERHEQLLIDIRDLEFMDSSGLRVLLEAAADAARDGWNLTITRPPEGGVLRLFQLTQALETLPLADPEDR